MFLNKLTEKSVSCSVHKCYQSLSVAEVGRVSLLDVVNVWRRLSAVYRKRDFFSLLAERSSFRLIYIRLSFEMLMNTDLSGVVVVLLMYKPLYGS